VLNIILYLPPRHLLYLQAPLLYYVDTVSLVSKYILYSWALCTDLHLYLLAISTTNPHGWGANFFSIDFHYYHHQDDTPLHHTKILKWWIFLYLTYFLNGLLWYLLCFCSCVPQNLYGSTVQLFSSISFLLPSSRGHSSSQFSIKKFKKFRSVEVSWYTWTKNEAITKVNCSKRK